MDKLKRGDKLKIQCYKHNGKIHREWDEAIFLDEKEESLLNFLKNCDLVNNILYLYFDFDFCIFPNGEYKILDKMEYKYHKKIMNYSDDLDKVVNDGLKTLIKKYKKNSEYFNADINREYCKLYKEIKNGNKKN